MLRTRLLLGLSPLLLLVVGMGLYAIFVCHQLAGTFQQQLIASYDASLAAQRMRDDAIRMDNAVSNLAGPSLADQRSFQANAEAFNRELMTEAHRAAGTGRAPFIARLDQAFEGFGRRGRPTPGTLPGSLAALDENETALHRVLAALDELEHFDSARAEAAAARARSLAGTTTKILAVVIVVAFLLALIQAWRLAASVVRPVRDLTASAVALGEGDLERTVPEFSAAEFTTLGRAFNTMAAKLRAYHEANAAKVLQTQRTMEATLNSTPDPLFVVAHDGRPAVRNPAAESLAASRAFAQGFPAALESRVREVLTSGQHFLPTGYDDLLPLRVGREDRYFQPRILAIGDSLTGFGGAAVLLQDVTRFRLLDDAKNNLVGTVSHELKTPLTSLRMAVYLLLEKNVGSLTPDQVELLETARDDADRLLRILNDLLDLSRLESGVARLHRTDVPVSELLETMSREIRPITDGHGQRLEVRQGPGVATVSVDPERIRHVFMNLLSNAAKYSPRDSAITLYAEAADAGFIRCGVRDEGPGIAPESVGRIFEKFYRLPGQTNQGAGLGLAISREIVLAHGGPIACVSRPGQGADFYFLLPGNSFDAPDTNRA